MSEQTVQAASKAPRMLIGRVVGDRMDKTIKVLIERRVQHPLYGKYVRRSTKLLAHDEGNTCRAGDLVAIEECRPISKLKAWRLKEIVQRAEQD